MDQQYIRNITHEDQVGFFFPGVNCSSNTKIINVICNVNRMDGIKKESPNGAEKSFGKI
jgi:hypothetical protein